MRNPQWTYVAASDEVEARMRFESGLYQQTLTEARELAKKLTDEDPCNERCQFKVWKRTESWEEV